MEISIRKSTLVLALAAVLTSAGAQARKPVIENQWPQWRGPHADGVAPQGDPPISWSETQNLRWKTSIPGKGHSTPIVWGERIFLTTALQHGPERPAGFRDAPGAHHNLPPARGQKFIVLAVDRRDGTILWQRTVRDEIPHEGVHETGTWASNSAVTDGKRLYAFFGSRGLYALDLDGKVLWEKDLGQMQTKHGHGEGSSPALHGDSLVITWDHEGASFVTALDKKTGAERWKVERNEITSWSTPLIVEVEGKVQVIVNGTERIRAYDLEDGSVIWECGGLSRNIVASPVAGAGFVYVGNSYNQRAIMAIRLAGARGDLTGTDAVVWSRHRDTPYVPSPVLYDGVLCYLKHNQAFLTCLDARSGSPLYGLQRLPGIQQVFASPVGAAGRLYIPSRNGATLVVRHQPTFEVLGVNLLEDSFSASPAVVGDELILRGERFLYNIARPETGTIRANPR